MSNSLVKGVAPQVSVEVTKEHIEDGVARNSNHCMIAEAVRTARPRLSHICVDIQTIRATDRERGERYIWITPRAAQQMIVDFDRGKKPKPFAITLRAGQTIQTETMTEERKAQKRAYARKYAETRKKKGKVKTAKMKANKRGAHGLPHISGGQAPPRSIGSRRAFGLRALVI